MDQHTSNQAAVKHWNREAVGSQRSGAAQGTERYFDEIRAYRYGYETPFIPRLFDFAAMRGKQVLEIGVGNGIDAVEMAKHGAIYTGVDITPNHLNLTRQHFELKLDKLNLRPPTLLEGDLTELILPGLYDYIYSFGVLHHISHEEQYLKQIRQSLTADGRLLIAVYSKYSFFNLYMIATWLLKTRARVPLVHWQSHVAERTLLDSPVEIKIRSRKEVEALLSRCGFEVVRYRKRGFVQNYLPFIGRWFQPDGFCLNFLGSLLGWYHLFICRKKAGDEARTGNNHADAGGKT